MYKKHHTNIIRVKEIDLNNTKPFRGGFIIYTVVNGVMYFGLGLDRDTHDLTDFGGGIKDDPNCVLGAIREFQEESLDIFEGINFEAVKDCLAVVNKFNLIIFIHINEHPNEISRRFNEKHELAKDLNPEVCGITWLTKMEFRQSISEQGIIFVRVKNFLNEAGEFLNYL